LSKRYEISYILNERYQRQGLMKEALSHFIRFSFKKLEFHRAQAKCSKDNLASAKLLEASGMRREGIHKDYWLINQKYEDVLSYAVINQ